MRSVKIAAGFVLLGAALSMAQQTPPPAGAPGAPGAPGGPGRGGPGHRRLAAGAPPGSGTAGPGRPGRPATSMIR